MRGYLPTEDVAIFLDLLSDTSNERYNLQELIHFLIEAPPAPPLSTPLNSGTTSKPPQQPIEVEAKEDDLHSLR